MPYKSDVMSELITCTDCEYEVRTHTYVSCSFPGSLAPSLHDNYLLDRRKIEDSSSSYATPRLVATQ